MSVHRNVANLVSHHDASANASLTFAVDVLNVRHVIVVGHYDCGGVGAALTGDDTSGWLAPLRALRRRHSVELDPIADEQRRFDRLCELNVVEQVAQVALHPIVADAWRCGRKLTIHGLIYAVGNGRLRTICAPVSGAFHPHLSTAMSEDDFDRNIM